MNEVIFVIVELLVIILLGVTAYVGFVYITSLNYDVAAYDRTIDILLIETIEDAENKCNEIEFYKSACYNAILGVKAIRKSEINKEFCDKITNNDYYGYKWFSQNREYIKETRRVEERCYELQKGQFTYS